MTLQTIIQNAEYFVNQLLDDEVHVVMGIARKKYNPEIPSATDYRKVGIWREIITKKDYKQKIAKIYILCKYYEHEIAKPEDYNIYITHNPRSPHKALVTFKDFLARYDYDPNPNSLIHFNSEWFSNLQGSEGRSRKVSFCLDIDTKDIKTLNKIRKEFKVLWETPTRNGIHVIIEPQQLDVQRIPGKTLLKGYTNVEVGYDRLVYVGRI